MSNQGPDTPTTFAPDEETGRALLSALRGPCDEPTKQPCAACNACPICHGSHLATAEQNAIWRARGARKGTEP